MAGEHNALNATAAAALAFGHGVSKESIQGALATFKSVKRRLEVRAEIGGITVVEDFAHHPTAIRETLRALRSVYPQARLWAVLEPRSNTLRRKVLETESSREPAPGRSRCAGRRVSAARIPEDERLHPEEVVARAQSGRNARRALRGCGVHREQHRAAVAEPATWWRFSPMAASTASMRNSPRGSGSFMISPGLKNVRV